MGKFIRKVRLDEVWRITEQEAWFEEMSRKGLHLKKLGNFIATFKKGEVSDLYYKIEPSNRIKLSSDQLERSEQLGFEYVTNHTNNFTTFHVFSTTNEQAKEENIIEREVQTKAIETVGKWYKRSIILSVLAILTFLVIFLLIALMDDTPTYNFVIYSNVHLLLIVLLNFLFLIYILYSSLKKIRQLNPGELGRTVNTSSTTRKHRRTIIIRVIVIYLLIFSGFLFMPFIKIYNMDTKTLPDEEHDLPIIRLADIEQNPNLRRDSLEMEREGTDWNNHYFIDWSFFAPIQYDSTETSTDEENGYSSRLNMKVFQLRFSQLAAPFMDDLIKCYERIVKEEDFSKVDDSRFDELLIYDNGLIKTIVARKGRAVAYIDYNGKATQEILFEQLNNRLSYISE